MKNFIKILVLICMCTSTFIGCTSMPNSSDEVIYNYEEVKDILIRFHVIANSDSDEDQNLKLKVRDEVIEYLYPMLKESKSLDESRKILLDNEDEVNNIAQDVIKGNGYNYKTKIQLSHENFPEKSYGNIILPQGNYEAFRIIIGSGEGRNWWCVMFPPLCFIDVTKGKVEEDESKKELDREVEKNRDDGSKSEEDDEEKVVVKFKLFEILKDLFN